ncbi:calcium-binding protein [Ensifer aridi]|uniref:calcium-binding protein n=1 Tax=Ensifer aridi TaxID=1708715 RepID=UPI0003FEEE81|nr:calcium-binding protein [Ensifer aridi]
MIGGLGSDTYLYALGDGSDRINESASESAAVDKLRFTDLTSSDISAVRVGKDLKITVLGTGDIITVNGQWSSSTGYFGIEKIEFANGESWDRSTITASAPFIGTANSDTLQATPGNEVIQGGLGDDYLFGGAGSDVYIYGAGDGSDFIYEQMNEANAVDALRFVDLTASDISAVRKGSNLEISVLPTDHVITIAEQYYNPSAYYGVEKIEFSDGTFWDRSTIMAIEQAPSVPTPGDDTLYGSSGEDIFQGGRGDDLLFGAEGADTYIYASGDGSDYIDDEADISTEVDTLQFVDLVASDISAARNGVNLEITVLTSGDVITIDEQWYDPDGYWGIERIEFADGSSWDRSTIMSIQGDTGMLM